MPLLDTVGDAVGASLGLKLDCLLGETVGRMDGLELDAAEGRRDGEALPCATGCIEGRSDGVAAGAFVGIAVFVTVGLVGAVVLTAASADVLPSLATVGWDVGVPLTGTPISLESTVGALVVTGGMNGLPPCRAAVGAAVSVVVRFIMVASIASPRLASKTGTPIV